MPFRSSWVTFSKQFTFRSGQNSFDSSAYMLILNALTGQPSNNAISDEEAPSDDNNDDGKSSRNSNFYFYSF